MLDWAARKSIVICWAYVFLFLNFTWMNTKTQQDILKKSLTGKNLYIHPFVPVVMWYVVWKHNNCDAINRLIFIKLALSLIFHLFHVLMLSLIISQVYYISIKDLSNRTLHFNHRIKIFSIMYNNHNSMNEKSSIFIQ